MTALGAFAAALLLGPAAAQIVQLKSGALLVGKIDGSPHEEGLTFRRLNGGVLDLTWDQLSLESQTKLKTMYNLSVDQESEYMVPADRLKWELAGGGSEEVVGRIVDEDDSTITIRRRGVNYPVQRSAIRGRQELQVPALDVYTATEFYNLKLAEIDPGDDADKHVALADVLMRVRDYDHAAEHLERAAELGTSRQPTLIEAKRKQLALYREAKSERELLDRIGTMMARKEFAKGADLVAEFDQKFPHSKLRGEFERLKKRFEKVRDRHLIGEVISLWSKTLYALARAKATEAGLAFDAAKDYAESQMGQDIRARVAKVLGLKVEEVEDLWGKRLDYLGARSEQFHYGVGSWTLGAQGVLEGTKQAAAESQESGKKSEYDKEMERILKRIKRAQERTKRALARQGSKEKQEQTPEEWWENAPVDQKKSWLRAYYVEFGGDYAIVRKNLTECSSCAGMGSKIDQGSTGETRKIKCEVCHGTRFKRWLRAH